LCTGGRSNRDERLQALAGLHRLLAVGDRRGLLEDHCRELCILLVKVFGREDVTPWVQMEDIPLSCEQSLKIALIVVELVMNCLKHSLTNGNGGTIWIDLRRSFCGLELSVCDSLRAPPKEGVTPRILAALARSLQGEVFVLDRDGYTAGVRIPHAALGGPPISRFTSTARRPATQRAQTLSAAQV
jgi:two-component sensor histidine kinase